MKKILSAVMACLSIASYAFAGGKATAGQAVAMAEKAKAYIEEKGNDKAFAEFNKKNGRFMNKDLYIWIVDYNGKVLSHGANPGLVGQNLFDLRDTEGKYFIREAIKIVKEKGKGWIYYKWTNPVSKKIEAKSTYLVTAGDLVIGCGIYK